MKVLPNNVVTLFVHSIVAYYFWSINYGYIAATYWHVLNPASLGLDVPSLIGFALCTIIIPALFQIPFLSKVFNLIQKYFMLANAAILVLLAISSVGPYHIRTAFLSLAAIGMLLLAVSITTMELEKSDLNLERILPWANVIGIFFMLVLRWDLASANPIYMSLAGGIVMPLLGALVSVIWHFQKSRFEDKNAEMSSFSGEATGDADVSIDIQVQEKQVEEVGEGSIGKGQQIGFDILMGLAIGALNFLTMITFISSSSLSVLVGLRPTVAGAFIILSFGVGIVCAKAIPLAWKWKKLNVSVNEKNQAWLLWTFIFILTIIGVAFLYLGGGAGLIGALILGIALPSTWKAAFSHFLRAVKHKGLALCFAGMINLFAFALVLAVLTGKSAPILGPQIHNHIDSLVWMLVLICGITGIIALVMVRRTLTRKVKIDDDWMEWKTLFIILSIIFVLVWFPGIIARGTWSLRASHTSHLKVGSFNIEQSYSYPNGQANFMDVTSYIQAHDLDLVGIQESDPVHPMSGGRDVVGYIAQNLGYEQYFSGASWYTYSVGVASVASVPLSSVTTEVLPTVKNCTRCPLINRLLQKGTVSFNSTSILWMNTHLSLPRWSSAAAIQMAYIRSILAANPQLPAIVVGDFNIQPLDPIMLDFIQTTGLTDAFVAKFNQSDVQHRTPPTDAYGQKSIDYIFYKGLNLLDFDVVDVKGASDHQLLWASFATTS